MDTLATLEIFIQVSEKGSFSAVARTMSVSVSTVTLAIQNLEKQVGGALFHRTTRQIVLTELGQQFLSDAWRIVEDWQSTLNHLKSGQDLVGVIRMTAPNHLGRTKLLSLIDQFIKLHPKVEIQLLLSDNVTDLFRTNIDVALRTGPLVDSGLKSRLLMHGRRLVCAAPEYWQSYGYPQHPNHLSEYNCLFLNDFEVKRNSWKFKDQRGIFNVKVQGNRTANDGSILYYWALQGIGATLQMEWDIIEDRVAGRIETVLEEYTAQSYDLYAVYHPQANMKVTAWVDFLIEQFSL